MEETKKTAATKAVAAKATSTKTAVKDTVKKAEEAVPAAKETKVSVKPAETVKAKAPAKKAAKTTKTTKPAAKKVEATVSVQFSGKSYTTEELVAIAKDVWKYDLKKKVSDFKSVELYVKPEENQAYYVINGEYSGSFFI